MHYHIQFSKSPNSPPKDNQKNLWIVHGCLLKIGMLKVYSILFVVVDPQIEIMLFKSPYASICCFVKFSPTKKICLHFDATIGEGYSC